jgi:hypothetical protein
LAVASLSGMGATRKTESCDCLHCLSFLHRKPSLRRSK